MENMIVILLSILAIFGWYVLYTYGFSLNAFVATFILVFDGIGTILLLKYFEARLTTKNKLFTS